MSADLVNRLAAIVRPVAENTKFAREPEKARERLARLVKFAEEHLKEEVELPKISKAKVTLDQADMAIRRLLIHLQDVLDIPVDGLADHYQLNRKNWSILRHLPITIWHVDQQLRGPQGLQSALCEIRSDLDSFRDRRNRRHEIHNVIRRCIKFFDEYLGANKITKSARLLSNFVDALFSELNNPLPSPKIVRACVEEYYSMEAGLRKRKIVRPDSN
jgi:hypothetical protein